MNESSKISPNNTKTNFGRYDKGHKNGYVVVIQDVVKEIPWYG